jgi:hypothetical protein
MKAMTRAMKYANRYGYPDGGINDEIAKITASSRERPARCRLRRDPRRVRHDLPPARPRPRRRGPFVQHLLLARDGAQSRHHQGALLPDFRQDIPAMINATRRNARDVGLVYLCNPNNPTGRLVTKDEVRQQLDGIPEDVPVLIDEAYHHFVDSPSYATSVPYVLEGRQVIVARTFSKIAALAGMRLGYALAPRSLIQRMRPYSAGSINAS